jgi:hypothetical protein
LWWWQNDHSFQLLWILTQNADHPENVRIMILISKSHEHWHLRSLERGFKRADRRLKKRFQSIQCELVLLVCFCSGAKQAAHRPSIVGSLAVSFTWTGRPELAPVQPLNLSIKAFRCQES